MLTLGESYGWHGEYLNDGDNPKIFNANPAQWDASLYHADAEKKANILINQVNEIANGTASKENVMFMYGDDFAYMNAFACF